MNPEYLDKEIYKRAKKIIDNQYKKHSAYKSMQLVKKYKDLGGRISGKAKGGTTRWNEEKWKNLSSVALGLSTIANAPKCGVKHAKQGNNKSICRPTVKVSSKTPKLAQAYTKSQIKKAQTIKNNGKRINWSKL